MKSDGSSGGVIDEERGPTFLQSIHTLLPPALSRRLIAAIATPFKPIVDIPQAPAPPPAADPSSDSASKQGEETETSRNWPPTPPPFSNKPSSGPANPPRPRTAQTRPWAALHTLALPANYDIQIFHAPNDSLPELCQDAWKTLMRADAAAAAAATTTSAFLLICDARWRRPGSRLCVCVCVCLCVCVLRGSSM